MAGADEEVDYLIIGAGMAGLVLFHLLATDSKVLLDPHPLRYKLGESLIPEHFADPRFADLRIAAGGLPSASPKCGSLFVGEGTVASFPLPPGDTRRALHVNRDELEGLMLARWAVPVRRARVERIDFTTKRVETTAGTFRVRRQVLDCSGPAMVVARSLGLVERLWPSWAGWIYYDLHGWNDQRFRDFTRTSVHSYRRYDPGVGQELSPDEDPTWSPSACTLVTRVRPGTWAWQIPLYNRTRLSLGVTSCDGPVTPGDLQALGETVRAPQWDLSLRPLDRSSRHNTFHQYNHFARRARTAASLDWILLGDACFFGEPVYATGTAVAVLQAARVADTLNAGEWDATACAAYNQECDLLARVGCEVHRYSYTRSPAVVPGAAPPVDPLYAGTDFQLTMARNYGRVLHAVKRWQADPGAHQDTVLDTDERGAEALGTVVRALLGVPGGVPGDVGVAGWRLRGARKTSSGLHLAWEHGTLPRLMMEIRPLAVEPRAVVKAGPIGLGLRDLPEGPYPYTPPVRALFSAVAARVTPRWEQWLAACVGSPPPGVK